MLVLELRFIVDTNAEAERQLFLGHTDHLPSCKCSNDEEDEKDEQVFCLCAVRHL